MHANDHTVLFQSQAQVEYLEGLVVEPRPSYPPMVVNSPIQHPWVTRGHSNHIYFPLKRSTLNSRGSSAQSFNISRLQMSLEPESSMSGSDGSEGQDETADTIIKKQESVQ